MYLHDLTFIYGLPAFINTGCFTEGFTEWLKSSHGRNAGIMKSSSRLNFEWQIHPRKSALGMMTSIAEAKACRWYRSVIEQTGSS